MLLVAAAPPVQAVTVAEQVAAVARWRADRLAKNAPAIDPSVYDRLDSDHPVITGLATIPGVAAGKGWAVAILDQAIEHVWMALNSEDRVAGLYGLSVSGIVQGDAKRSNRLVFQLLPLPLFADRWWIVREQMNGPLYTESGGRLWELVSTDATDDRSLSGTRWASDAATGQPVAWTESAWLLQRLDDGRTLGEYYCWTDPGGHLPARLASRFAAGALADAVHDTETLASSLSSTPRTGFVRPDGSPL